MNIKRTIFDQLGLPKLPSYCWLLTVGYVLAPMTSWRIWKIGPGELLCLAACIDYLHQRAAKEGGSFMLRFRFNFLSEFWTVFISIVVVGTVWCVIFFPKESDAIQLLTWLYFAIVSTVTYDALSECENIEKVLLLAVSLNVIWYAMLYLYSEYVSPTLFGASLWYGGIRYTGGANNPHQVALPLVTAAVVLLANAFKQKELKKKLIQSVLAAISIWLLYKTESTTGKMSLVVGLGTILLSHINNRKLVLAIACLAISVCLVFHEQIFGAFLEWVQSDSNGEGRLEIFKSYTYIIDKSPLFGLGPGTHGMNGTIEFHNTYLEVFAMSGFLGAFVFLFFSVQLWTHVRISPVAVSTMFALYAFGFAGFAMRRLSYWMILIFVTVLADQSKSKTYSGDWLVEPTWDGIRTI